MKSYLIMMAVQLMEMRRILKETGSIYLHCDPTASHYLKMLMDAVIGRNLFRNEIQWRRYRTHNDVGQGSRHYGRVHDILLFYSKAEKPTWNQVFVPLDKEYVEKTYRRVEEQTGRRFTTTPMTGPGGESKGNPVFEWNGHVRAWRYSRETVERLDKEGRLYYSRTGYPRRKLYLDESRGSPVQDVWEDIRSLSGAHKERVGYPTQKPLALLERIIRASSNDGDTVLDPFCGCATALVVSEKLGRHWVGIDLSSLAVNLFLSRLQEAADDGALLHSGKLPDVHHRTDIPSRTDQGDLPSYRTHRHTLYGRQEGVRAGCQVMFPFRNMTVDHVVPQSKGGTDHLDNLQLLCAACNSMKGVLSQEAFIARLKKEGLRQ